MATSAVNFFQPGTDASVDVNSILRERALAQAMMQQGMTQNPGSMVGGHYVAPGAMSYVNQLAQMLGGQFIGSQADQRERDLGEKVRAKNAVEANSFVQALQGTPSKTQQIPTNAPSDANPDGNFVESTPVTTPGIAADPNRALAMAMQSQNPALQAAGGKLLENQMTAAQIRDGLAAAGLGGAAPAGGGAPSAGPSGAGPAPGVSGAGASPSGVPAGVSPQAFALTLSPNAQLNKLGTMVQDAYKPVVLAEGGTALTHAPDGTLVPSYVAPKTEAGINVVPIAGQPGQFQASTVRGYAEAKANAAGLSAGAVKAAEDPYAPQIKVDMLSGPRLMTPAQARAVGGATTGPQGPTNAAERGMAADIASVPYDIQKEIANTQTMLNTPGMIKDPGDRAQAVAYLSKLQGQAQSQGSTAAQPAPQGGLPGIALQTDEQAAYDKARATAFAKTAETIAQDTATARSMRGNLDLLDQLYKDPNVTQGAAAESISNLKNLGASVGVDVKGLGAEQAVQSITNKMALQLRSTADGGGMPGSMSDSDRRFLSNMTPGLANSPEGRALISSAMRATAERQLKIGEMATQYEQQNGRLDVGFQKQVQDYANANPLFANQKVPAAAAAPAPLDLQSLARQELQRRQKGK